MYSNLVFNNKVNFEISIIFFRILVPLPLLFFPVLVFSTTPIPNPDSWIVFCQEEKCNVGFQSYTEFNKVIRSWDTKIGALPDGYDEVLNRYFLDENIPDGLHIFYVENNHCQVNILNQDSLTIDGCRLGRVTTFKNAGHEDYLVHVKNHVIREFETEVMVQNRKGETHEICQDKSKITIDRKKFYNSILFGVFVLFGFLIWFSKKDS